MRLTILFLLLSSIAYGQSRYYIRADSVFIEKGGGNGELILLNGTKGVKGLLTNVGNGRTQFKASRLSGDTLFVGMDTLIGGGSQNLQQVTNNGAQTTDTVLVKALSTNVIMPDTADQDDYEIVLLPDTQYEPSLFPAQGRSVFRWIADNKVSQNIKAVIGLGDIVHSATSAEFDTADAWYDLLDPLDIPYVPTIGNHDYFGGSPIYSDHDATAYNNKFGPSRFSGKTWYQGNYMGSNENFFVSFEINGKKISVMALEFYPRNAIIDWADSVVLANPDREFWIATHAYINMWGERAVDTSQSGPNTYSSGFFNYSTGAQSGQELWENFIRNHSNIAFVFSGHFALSVATYGTHPYGYNFSDVGLKGNVIHQLYSDFQTDTSGGNGYIMRLKFKPRENKVDVRFFSAYTGAEDTEILPYTLNYPGINIEAAVGARNLYVSKEAQFDSTVAVGSLRKGGIVAAGARGLLQTPTYLNMTNDTLGATYLKVPTKLQADSSQFAANTDWVSQYFIRTGVTYKQSKSMWVNGPIYVGGLSTTKTTLGAGLGITLAVNQPTSNYGFLVGRYETTPTTPLTGTPNMNFFRSRNDDPTVRAHLYPGDGLGRLSWWSPTIAQTADGLPLSIIGIVKDTVSNFLNTRLDIRVSYPTDVGTHFTRFGVHGWGAIVNGDTLDASAAFQINTNYQGTRGGFLPPRVTAAERALISSPATGLRVYDTDSSKDGQYNGSAWKFPLYTTDIPALAGTTYTPTATNGANVDASTPFAVHYTRVGTTVTFSGTIDIDETLAVGSTIVELSLPIASNFTSTVDASGWVSPTNVGQFGGYITASVANDRIVVEVIGISTGTVTYKFGGSYTIK